MFFDFAVTGLNDTLHVVAVMSTASLSPNPLILPVKFTVRSSNLLGWKPWEGFSNYFQVTPNDFNFSDIACADTGGVVHVCLPGVNNHHWHFTEPIFPFDPFEDVKNAVTPDPGDISSVAIAGIGDKLHVCTIVKDEVWHTIKVGNVWKNPEVNGMPFWGNVTKALGGVGFQGVPRDVACARADENLHICCINDTGQIFHTIRVSNPAIWKNPERTGKAQWGDATQAAKPVPTNYGPFRQVAVSGDNNPANPLDGIDLRDGTLLEGFDGERPPIVPYA